MKWMDARDTGTQADQNKEDEKARHKAQAQLVQSWMDRLQLISVIVSPQLAPCVRRLLTIVPNLDHLLRSE
jgi:hypothetical protein